MSHWSLSRAAWHSLAEKREVVAQRLPFKVAVLGQKGCDQKHNACAHPHRGDTVHATEALLGSRVACG